MAQGPRRKRRLESGDQVTARHDMETRNYRFWWWAKLTHYGGPNVRLWRNKISSRGCGCISRSRCQAGAMPGDCLIPA